MSKREVATKNDIQKIKTNMQKQQGRGVATNKEVLKASANKKEMKRNR